MVIPVYSPCNEEPFDILEHRLLWEAKGLLETIKWLLDKGINIERPTFTVGNIVTLLYHSALGSKPEITQLLMDRGADVNAVTMPPGLTALYGPVGGVIKIECVHETTCLLLESGADAGIRTDNRERDSPLYRAGREGLTIIIKVPLAHSAAIEATGLSRALFSIHRGSSWTPDDQEYTPLMVAVESGQDAALLTSRANIHARLPASIFDDLCLAVIQGRHKHELGTETRKIIKILLEYGADVNRRVDIPGHPNVSLLFLAKDLGSVAVIDLLLGTGAELYVDSSSTLQAWIEDDWPHRQDRRGFKHDPVGVLEVLHGLAEKRWVWC